MIKKVLPVDASKRPTYDEGGRHPLTEVSMVPTVVVCDWPLWLLIEECVNQFISPMTQKPYGISALCRVIVSEQVSLIDRYTAADFLDYVPKGSKGSTGRYAVSDDGSVKMAIALRKTDIDLINKRVLELDHNLIGTTTIVRLLLRKGMTTFDIGRMYTHIPDRHKNYMLERQIKIKELQDRYRKSEKYRARKDKI